MSTMILDQPLNTGKTENPVGHKNQEKDLLYIDVRTPQEFESMHIANARNMPLPDLPKYLEELRKLSQEHSLVFVCRTQNRSKMACDYLGANGFTNCHALEGGINGWMALGKPVIKGQHRLSLEGQVRAITGGMILIGVALGFTIHSGFFLLPAIVGAGLLHAGLTDSCLMGLLLSKLPMNRIGNSRSAQEKKGDSL